MVDRQSYKYDKVRLMLDQLAVGNDHVDNAIH